MVAIPSGLCRARNPPPGRKYDKKKTTKKLQHPHPGLGPEDTKKISKIYKNDLIMTTSVFFLYFRGPTQGGGLCNFFVTFSVFPALEGFRALY